MTFLFHRKDLIPLLLHAKKSLNHSGGYEEGPVGPGLLLVSDFGVYLMSNGIPRGEGEQVVYADGL